MWGARRTFTPFVFAKKSSYAHLRRWIRNKLGWENSIGVSIYQSSKSDSINIFPCTYQSRVYMSHSCVNTANISSAHLRTVANGPNLGSDPNCSAIVTPLLESWFWYIESAQIQKGPSSPDRSIASTKSHIGSSHACCINNGVNRKTISMRVKIEQQNCSLIENVNVIHQRMVED